MRNHFLIFLLLVIFCAIVPAQQDSLLTDDLIEIYTPETESGENEFIPDDISSLLENPVDINSAEESDLNKIPFISENQVKAILNYRDSAGVISSLDEIFDIPVMNSADKDVLRQYLRVNKPEHGKDESAKNPLRIQFRNRIISDSYVNEEALYSSNYKAYHRLKLDYGNNYSANVLSEKDPGENNYSDFKSFSLRIKNLPDKTELVLGDYTVQFGQGLVLWSPYTTLKSSEATTGISRSGKNIKPYTGSDEFSFFRGAAGELEFHPVKMSLYYSRKNIDATIDDDGFISGLRKSGYHRTESDKLFRNNTQMIFYGARADISFTASLKLSFLLTRSSLNRKYSSESNYSGIPENISNFSTSYQYNFMKLYVKGETSVYKGNYATVNSIGIAATGNFRVITSVRYCQENYFSYFSNPFGESSSDLKFEKGFYTGLKWNTGFGTVNSYYDFFRIKRKNFDLFPADGNEFMISYLISPVRNLSSRITYKIKRKYDMTELIKSGKIRLDIYYKLSRELSLKSRYEYKSINKPAEKGEMFYQDMKYSVFSGLILNLRYLSFRTDSYSTAVYEFENDLPGVFYSPPLYGDGVKWYINISYKILDFVFSAKYSEMTVYDKYDSGMDFISLSRKRQRFGIQVEYSPIF